MNVERLLPRAFALALLALLALAAWQWRDGPPVAADMLALLPESANDPLARQAEQRMQEPLSRDLLILVGHPQEEQALALTRGVAEHWQRSGLFQGLRWNLDRDLDELRQQLLAGRLALLSPAERQLLEERPGDFIAQRAAELFDPFAANLLPLEQDWLGLSAQLQQSGRLHLDLTSATLQVTAQGQTWIALHARSQGAAFDMQAAPLIAAEVEQARAQVEAAGGQLLAASGLLFAAAGQEQAIRESVWIGGGSTLGILLLLLYAWRQPRALLALLPVGVALVSGVTVCVLVFGQINALTLVLGASLVGVASDYPLHYLSKSWSQGPWHSWKRLFEVLPGLSLSLGTNLIGYLALAFTPFPALTQIALFSAAGLVAAYLCAICLLPACFATVQPRPAQGLLRLSQRLLAGRARVLRRIGSKPLLGLLLLFCAGGLWQLHTQNDLRQWLGQAPELLGEARRIAELTGQQPTSQFFLVQSRDETQLLERQGALAQRLDALVGDGQLQGYRALSQLIASIPEQQHLRQALAQLPEHWQPLLALGVPETALRGELTRLLALPTLDIEQVLGGPLAEAWRPLWLGRQADGRVAALVSLQGQPTSSSLESAAQGLDGVQLIDRPGELNRLFSATQLSAAELKLLSCAAILLLLWLPFGLSGALRLVGLPLLAAMTALACLGWLGQPLTLFSLFGLLLITAIGVDYSILMREAIGGAAVSLIGVLLAGVTSWLAFGLLLLSGTPAIANFGLAVSLGLLFCCLLSPWAAKSERGTHSTDPLQ